ncbi:MAG: nucleotidyltransferase family protein [Thermoanaerobacteraceae bacterium]|nr:nucleotidyltransferase family protein [Thermoanaerobacteraceae bacterium]
MDIQEIRAKTAPVFHRHGVVRAALFGSHAKGEAMEESDLDILVEFEGEKTLLDLVALRMELEETLGKEVDVLTYRALHPRIKDKVLQEQVALL